MITQSIDRQRTLELDVGGFECDWTILKNCVTESSTAWGDFDAIAKLEFDVRDAMERRPDPAGQGTGLPRGHDAYPVWETTDAIPEVPRLRDRGRPPFLISDREAPRGGWGASHSR